ncbi:MAG: NAD(P)-binding protein [Gammaproteobacteria bacterium]|nr:NAD(P)-binding protein [Gammaproteobacteria bacterium]
MKTLFNVPLQKDVGADDGWLPAYPSPPDFRFNYYHLLTLAKDNANSIGNAPNSDNPPTIGIVGCGIAGITAARELYRCGYNIILIEATGSIGGRHYTIHTDEVTDMEMGAMRFPFFSKPGSKNSVSEYYILDEGNCTLQDFPNPGAAPGNTGIYINKGYGPDNEYSKPTLIDWPYTPSNPSPPDNDKLKEVYQKVSAFITLFTQKASRFYGGTEWDKFWKNVSNNYEQMNVNDLVYTPAITEYQDDGWFGGFGMNDDQAQIFALIGSGDGSWGAFYEVSSMWFIRCVMFGFNSNLQTVVGIADKSNLPHYKSDVTDSKGDKLEPPLYKGIQALDEWLFYAPPPGSDLSLYDASKQSNPNVRILVNSPVTELQKDSQTGKIRINLYEDTIEKTYEVDHVVVTPTLWTSELSINLTGFAQSEMPSSVLSARNSQHNITSCKVFYKLKETYWENGVSKIPQILVTDEYVQDAYGIKWSDESGEHGVLLASYTWEDDATKLLAFDDDYIGSFLLNKLDEICKSTLGESIIQYVDTSEGATIIHWSIEPYFHGCAKLYRQRNWALNYALLTYNQVYSSNSKIYFAGENYSVEGGWTEPALRMALDATINILKNSNGTFNNGFDPNTNYPKYDTSFIPANTYPSPHFQKSSS